MNVEFLNQFNAGEDKDEIEKTHSLLKPVLKNMEWWQVGEYIKETLANKIYKNVECIYSGVSLTKDYNYFNIEHVVPESIFRKVDYGEQIKKDYNITYPCILPINWMRQNYILSDISDADADIKINHLQKFSCSITGVEHPECSDSSEHFLVIRNKTHNHYNSLKEEFPNFDSKCLDFKQRGMNKKKSQCLGQYKFHKYISLVNLSPKESKDKKILSKLSEPVIKINTSKCDYKDWKRNIFNKCVYSPINKNKGIIARAIFYFYFTYSHINYIKNRLNKFLKDCSKSSCSKLDECDMGCKNILDLFIKWHEEHKIHRPNGNLSLEDLRNIEVYQQQKRWNIFVGLRDKKKKAYIPCPDKFVLFVFSPKKFKKLMIKLKSQQKTVECDEIRKYLKIIDRLYKTKTSGLIDELCPMTPPNTVTENITTDNNSKNPNFTKKKKTNKLSRQSVKIHRQSVNSPRQSVNSPRKSVKSPRKSVNTPRNNKPKLSKTCDSVSSSYLYNDKLNRECSQLDNCEYKSHFSGYYCVPK